MTQYSFCFSSHTQGSHQDELSRQQNVAERRRDEIENLRIAKQTMDAEVIGLVGTLEELSAEVC